MDRRVPTHQFDEALLSSLRARLASWFGEHARPLPWRETSDPYAIWLSEIILQQTQVVQGISYYYKFLELFPDVYALARASEDEVLHAWQGLGYYSRGRNLLKAAQMVVNDFGGVFPDTIEEIKRLPGVGPYTQAAVLSFAYNKAHAAVDGNVYRVLSRLYANATPIDTPEGQKLFRLLAEQLLDRENPGRHNQAMIELGALVCSPRKPDCLFCPLEAYCEAHSEGNPTDYPVKQGKTKVTERYLNFFYITLPGGKVLIERRGAGDIWQGLYQFPLVETAQQYPDAGGLLSDENFITLWETLQNPELRAVALSTRQHRLTHRLLHARLYEVQAEAYIGSDYQIVEKADLQSYGMPALLIKMLADCGK